MQELSESNHLQVGIIGNLTRWSDMGAFHLRDIFLFLEWHSQDRERNWRLASTFFFLIWTLQLSFWLRWTLTYLTCDDNGILSLLRVVCWREWGRRAKSTLADFLMLILVFHLLAQVANSLTATWRFSEAVEWSSWVARMAVSSANVTVVVALFAGKSAVNSTYRSGPKSFSAGPRPL